MNKVIFYILDVFAKEKYEGNQLAVFRNIENLSKIDLQKIAKEMNYSETTFISSETEKNGGYDVRIFTPEEEIPFAGHPTLGTAFVLQQKVIKQKIDTIKLNLGVGQIPVTFSYSGEEVRVMWMKQKTPVFSEIVSWKEVAAIINLEKDDLDERFPIQSVSTGLPFFIIPLKSLDAVRRAWVNSEKYFEFIGRHDAKDILIFCSETYDPENNLNVRVFAGYHGIPEDPATGSANGCLAGYLVKHRYFGKEMINIRVEQGCEIGRPSLLLLKAQCVREEMDVFVGGKAIFVAEGKLV